MTSDPQFRLVILDPGHFHAALVQKKMYAQVSDQVHVYAPEGPEVHDYLTRVESFNQRASDPTRWQTAVHCGPDYVERFVREQAGNVMVTAGNNRRKTEYLKLAADAGFHVLADKPMCIETQGWHLLCSAFESARNHDVLLYDIMTERFEITSILQRELVQVSDVFGTLKHGTPDDPAIIKESVHHLSKTVAGKPLRRPPWYFDVAQQGEGIVDVTTHLVDLVMWICFPEQTIRYATDVEVVGARRWPTTLTLPEFESITGLPEFPPYLRNDVRAGKLNYYCNGELSYRLKGAHVKIVVRWDYRAPEVGGDTHESRICGTKADIVIHQGKAQNYQPELYIEPAGADGHATCESALKSFIVRIQECYPGVDLKDERRHWHLLIPERYRVGHEAHFSEVTESYLRFLKRGALPDTGP
jgi:predicted dehydrogenase